MKIVTYNVNGLRARIVPYKTLHAFLSAIDADIICFQETKLSRQELTGDIALVEGYEAFFSCTRTSSKGKIGYSGVATFCRATNTASESCTSGVLPCAADEGFTGLLHLSKGGDIEGIDRVGYHDDVLKMGLTQDMLLTLDNEGRCVITDHGSFVLFNVYGPSVHPDDQARMEFKLNFFQVLQCRWESLLRAGKRLIIVGDLNISPYPIDSCDPGPDFNANRFRKWLRSLLTSNGGPFTDVYRFIHGLKRGAYTCWSQASGADEFNYGTRIDLILAAGSCMHEDSGQYMNCKGFAQCEVLDCDIMIQFKRFKEDNLPRWAGGRTLKLEGSDHAPVYVLLKEQPAVRPHDIPSFAVRFLPQLRGRQQSIYALLKKHDQCIDATDLTSEPPKDMLQFSFQGGSFNANDLVAESQSDKVITSQSKLGTVGMEADNLQVKEKSNTLYWTLPKKQNASLKSQPSKKLKRKVVQKASQANLTDFFTHSSCGNSMSNKESMNNAAVWYKSENINSEGYRNCMQKSHDLNIVTKHSNFASIPETSFQDYEDVVTSIDMDNFGNENPNLDVDLDSRLWSATSGCSNVKDHNAQAQWKKIRDLMARCIPLCRHGEPCVARIVKKSGPNQGRGFYVCGRAAGPSSNPEARCDHFEWASEKLKK